MANKVLFGISNLHIATYTINDQGVATIGTPDAIPGAVSFSPSGSFNQNDFYADNKIYWTGRSNAKIEGDLVVAMLQDAIKTTYLGYKTLTNGGIAAVKNPDMPNVFIAFDVEGDIEKRRVALYNCTLGDVTRNYETINENKEPATETIPVTCIGDESTEVTMVTYKPEDAGYSVLYTAPTAPAF